MKSLKKSLKLHSTLLICSSCNCNCTDGYKDFKNNQIYISFNS
ncbi:hypothetical protein PV797_09440 [Clostridiaceae bacterium M8S5]|nr:hypothetical protein PV797_09440 [Clostridiaceae bacterium M8S5]